MFNKPLEECVKYGNWLACECIRLPGAQLPPLGKKPEFA